MKKFLIYITIIVSLSVNAQETVYPAPKQVGSTVITNATVHVGNGQVLNNATIVITDGKIAAVGNNISIPPGSTQVNAQGKQVYPGLILPVSNLGLVEIGAVRASNDVQELGDMNPNIHSIVAYNTDSKVINTLRSNGILLANVVPEGSFVAGQSSVVQLDAWNYEDAAYKTDGGLHVYMPLLLARPRRFRGAGPQQPDVDPVKEGLEKVDELKGFFHEAKALFTCQYSKANACGT